MLRFIRLLLRRLVTILFVSLLAYLTVFAIFPYFSQRVPLLVAVLVTYFLIAYFFVPAFFRFFRLFDKPDHIPNCTLTIDGWPAEPVNVAILTRNDSEFIEAMRRAGWYKADAITVKSSLKAAWAWTFDKSYPHAPFSRQYLFGRKQDIGFEIPVGDSPRRRHHIRFWKVTPASLLRSQKSYGNFWNRLLNKFWDEKRELWVGAGTYDSFPIALSWQNGQFRHMVHPDADIEREILVQTLRDAGLLKKVADIKAGEPYYGRAQHIGGRIISDGYVRLCELKPVRTKNK